MVILHAAQDIVERAECAMRATLAQLVEQLIRNHKVAGSNPAGGSRKPHAENQFNLPKQNACPQKPIQVAHRYQALARFAFLATRLDCKRPTATGVGSKLTPGDRAQGRQGWQRKAEAAQILMRARNSTVAHG